MILSLSMGTASMTFFPLKLQLVTVKEQYIQLITYSMSIFTICVLYLCFELQQFRCQRFFSLGGTNGCQFYCMILKAFSTVGTPDYIAPEVLLKKGYGVECDWLVSFLVAIHLDNLNIHFHLCGI